MKYLDSPNSDTLFSLSLINSEIESLNNISGTEKEWSKQLYKSQHKIMRKIEKDLKIVTKGYYTNMWMALGMSVFGLPMGLVFAFSLDNMAYLGIGLPIGMALGTAIGSGMDKKAKEEGRQIDCELQF